MKTKTIKTIMCLAITVALLPVAAFAQPTQQAQAKTVKPTITVTRVATGKVTIKNGSTYKLKAKATKGAKLTYKTSKKKICKVTSKGKLIAKKCGKATITIKAKKSGNVATKKIKVKVVKKSKFKKVKKIAFKAAQKSLYNGASVKLKIKFNPSNASNKNVTYKSSNPEIATVSADGKVTANKTGTVKITATSCDGSKKTTIKLNMLGECTHKWELIEQAHFGDCQQVTTDAYVICSCGLKFNNAEEQTAHVKSSEENRGHGYKTGSDEEVVYDIEPAIYQCSICGAAKSEIPETLDGEKLEKVSYYQCVCGVADSTYELMQRHLSVRDDTHTYTIKTGYCLVSE